MQDALGGGDAPPSTGMEGRPKIIRPHPFALHDSVIQLYSTIASLLHLSNRESSRYTYVLSYPRYGGVQVGVGGMTRRRLGPRRMPNVSTYHERRPKNYAGQGSGAWARGGRNWYRNALELAAGFPGEQRYQRHRRHIEAAHPEVFA